MDAQQRRPRSSDVAVEGRRSSIRPCLVLLAAGGVIVFFGLFVVLLAAVPLHLPAERDPRLQRPQARAAGRHRQRLQDPARRPRRSACRSSRRVSRMDMRLFPVEVAVQNAYSKGGIPLSVHAIANVKISSSDAGVRNAVERFLGTTPDADRDRRAADARRRAARGRLAAHARGGERGPAQVRRDARRERARRLRQARARARRAQGPARRRRSAVPREPRPRRASPPCCATRRTPRTPANQAVAEAQAAARQRAETAQKRAETRDRCRTQERLRAELAKLEARGQAGRERGRGRRRDRARRWPSRSSRRCAASSRSSASHCDVILPAEAQRKAAGAQGARRRGADGRERQGRRRGAPPGRAGVDRPPAPTARDVYVLQQLRDARHRGRRARARRREIGELNVVDGGDGDAFGARRRELPRRGRAGARGDRPRAWASTSRSARSGRERRGRCVDDRHRPGPRRSPRSSSSASSSYTLKNLLFVSSPERGADLLGRHATPASGRERRLPRRSAAAARVRIPLLERVDRMDLSNIPIEIAVKGAYSQGRHPAQRAGRRQREAARRRAAALERRRALPRPQRARRSRAIARETLEGNVRGVLAQLTPEQVNQDKTAFAQTSSSRRPSTT